MSCGSAVVYLCGIVSSVSWEIIYSQGAVGYFRRLGSVPLVGPLIREKRTRPHVSIAESNVWGSEMACAVSHASTISPRTVPMSHIFSVRSALGAQQQNQVKAAPFGAHDQTRFVATPMLVWMFFAAVKLTAVWRVRDATTTVGRKRDFV
jgi:hypothetical protein